ncbi:MAG: exosortase system-associated protein, TIGR04073 family [Candidatus Omnitrophica bacterium]|nr:exosortase system-associated protein, TIGR04073 family [Candidatus Omnitrophota bacterium]
MKHLPGVVLGAIVISGLLASRLDAARPPAPAATDKTDKLLLRYNLYPALGKLGRGVGNTLGGWLEFPLNIQKHYTQADTAASLFTGAAVGLVKGVIRTGVGVYETVTFVIPYPEEYAPILPTLEYFKRSEPRKELLLE